VKHISDGPEHSSGRCIYWMSVEGPWERAIDRE
jgi:hypothetical protein